MLGAKPLGNKKNTPANVSGGTNDHLHFHICKDFGAVVSRERIFKENNVSFFCFSFSFLRCMNSLNSDRSTAIHQTLHLYTRDHTDKTESMSALEQYFQHLQQLNLLSQALISDGQGATILAVHDGTNAMNEEAENMESNVALSGVRLFSSLDQLELGRPAYIHAQFHDSVVVHMMEGNIMLTVIGNRSLGHCAGSMISIAKQICAATVYQDALAECKQYMENQRALPLSSPVVMPTNRMNDGRHRMAVSGLIPAFPPLFYSHKYASFSLSLPFVVFPGATQCKGCGCISVPLTACCSGTRGTSRCLEESPALVPLPYLVDSIFINEAFAGVGSALLFSKTGDSVGSSYLYDDEEDASDSQRVSQTESVSMSGIDSQDATALARRRRRRRPAAQPMADISGPTGSLLSETRGSDSRTPTRDSVESESAERSSEYTDMTPSTPLLSPSDLSSSLSNLFYESPALLRLQRVARALERPLLFAVVTAAGSRFVQGLRRLCSTVSLTRNAMGWGTPREGPGLEVPDGYPLLPGWLHDLRAALPTFLVERPLAYCLRAHGVPVLSETMPGSTALTGSEDVWVSSGPMIPAAVFLPIFTLVLLQLARVVGRMRRADVGISLTAADDGSVSEVADAPYRERSPPGLEDEMVWGSDSPSPSASAQPQSDADSGYVRTPKGRALSPMDLTSRTDTKVPSALLTAPHAIHRFASGTVISALIGSPTVAEVNTVLLASLRYGCFKTILPLSTKTLDHIALPPSAPVEYSISVLDAAVEVANRRGMSLVGVLPDMRVPGAVHLRTFQHPPLCIYIFVAANCAEVEFLSRTAQSTVYVFEGEAQRSLIPINECFSQRQGDREKEDGGQLPSVLFLVLLSSLCILCGTTPHTSCPPRVRNIPVFLSFSYIRLVASSTEKQFTTVFSSFFFKDFFSILLFSLLLLAAVLHISPSRISGPVTASCDMLCAEPLHVQHSASALLSADPSGVVEGRNGSPVAEEQRVWQHCTVSRDLRVRLYRFGAASTFFTLPCVNASDVVRKDGEKAGVLSVLTRSAVLDSCVSWRTAVPHVAGSQSAHAADLLEAYNSNPLSAPDADAAELGGGKLAAERLTDGFARRSGKWLELLSLSLGLPTVAALVRCSAVSRTLLLLLRPHVHAGKSACLAYRAALVPMSDLTRRVCVSPCGTWTAALPERFAVEADPLRCGEPAAPLLTGELRATPVHFLAGAAAASPRRVERMAGTALAWAQCRLSAAPCGGLEVVLVSHRGTALVCAEGGAADSALCGVCYRCVRCFVCATRAASPSGRASVSSGEAGPTVRRHVPRQRVLGCSSDGVVLLCAPERTPREVTAVMAAAAPDNRRASVAPPAALLPEAFELHDTHVLTHPRFSGALLCGMSRAAAAGGSLRGAAAGCPAELHLLPFGGGEALPVSMSSFRSWRSLPAAFFQPGCALRFLGVEVVADPCGCDALLVVLGSTGAAKAAATALVTLPSAVAWLREFVLGAGACGAAPRVSGLAAAVELHVARGAAALRHRDEWAARHRRAGLEACDTTRCLMAELVPAPWLAAAAGRRGVAAAEDGLCAMVEECVDALRVELLDTQRAGGGDVGLCVSCVGAIFCGVQRGLDAVGLGNGGAAADAVIRRHRAFYGALARALLGALDVLECAGAASAIAAAAASVDPRPPAWGELLRPLFDAAFTATCGAPVLTGGLVPQCSPAVRAAVGLGSAWLPRESERRRVAIGDASCTLRTLPAPAGGHALAGGRGALASLTVLDIYWAARRLFLASGPAAALELLSSICGAASCAANVQQLRDMYAALDAKQRPIAERLGRSRPPRRRLSIDLKSPSPDFLLGCLGDSLQFATFFFMFLSGVFSCSQEGGVELMLCRSFVLQRGCVRSTAKLLAQWRCSVVLLQQAADVGPLGDAAPSPSVAVPASRQRCATAASEKRAADSGAAQQSSAPASDADDGVALPLQPTLNEEEEDLSAEQAQYTLFAYKALLWGTVYAVLGVAALSVAVMYALDLRSAGAVLVKVREKTERDMVRLTQRAQPSGEGGVKHYSLDLAQPGRAWEQMKEIWSAVLEEAEHGGQLLMRRCFMPETDCHLRSPRTALCLWVSAPVEPLRQHKLSEIFFSSLPPLASLGQKG
eukprot:gene9179-6456_t